MLIDSPAYDGAMPICLWESLNDRPRPRKTRRVSALFLPGPEWERVVQECDFCLGRLLALSRRPNWYNTRCQFSFV